MQPNHRNIVFLWHSSCIMHCGEPICGILPCVCRTLIFTSRLRIFLLKGPLVSYGCLTSRRALSDVKRLPATLVSLGRETPPAQGVTGGDPGVRWSCLYAEARPPLESISCVPVTEVLGFLLDVSQ